MDEQDVAVYHTNVMMCVGTDFAMIGADMVKSTSTSNTVTKQTLLEKLQATKKHVIELTHWQISQFCANAIELQGTDGKILALSNTALKALTPSQVSALEQSVRLVSFDVSALETAGGSVRCMLAGVHLAARN